MWQWVLCRCARCGSTNVKSIWWHKELRPWPLRTGHQQLGGVLSSSEDQSTANCCEPQCQGVVFGSRVRPELFIFWSFKPWMCLLLLCTMLHHSINNQMCFTKWRNLRNEFIPSVACYLLMCDDGGFFFIYFRLWFCFLSWICKELLTVNQHKQKHHQIWTCNVTKCWNIFCNKMCVQVEMCFSSMRVRLVFDLQMFGFYKIFSEITLKLQHFGIKGWVCQFLLLKSSVSTWCHSSRKK